MGCHRLGVLIHQPLDELPLPALLGDTALSATVAELNDAPLVVACPQSLLDFCGGGVHVGISFELPARRKCRPCRWEEWRVVSGERGGDGVGRSEQGVGRSIKSYGGGTDSCRIGGPTPAGEDICNLE